MRHDTISPMGPLFDLINWLKFICYWLQKQQQRRKLNRINKNRNEYKWAEGEKFFFCWQISICHFHSRKFLWLNPLRDEVLKVISVLQFSDDKASAGDKWKHQQPEVRQQIAAEIMNNFSCFISESVLNHIDEHEKCWELRQKIF